MPNAVYRRRLLVRTGRSAALVAGLFACGCEVFHGSLSSEHSTAPEPREVREGEVSRAAAPSTPTIPGKNATRHGYYVFYHDFDLNRNDPLFEELEALPERVFEELALPPGNTIVQVFLFETQERYDGFMRHRYPNLPSRRAYFIAEPRVGGGAGDLKVYTWMGDHIRTDLRHELTHATLHSVLKDVPLWLDEGLAGFFELPPENDGVNPQHLETLRRGELTPDMARLETFEKVKQMEKPEYREAWAWVHLMLRGKPEARKVLQDHLKALRTTANPGPLYPKLREALGDPDQALLEHINGLESPRRIVRVR